MEALDTGLHTMISHLCLTISYTDKVTEAPGQIKYKGFPV